MVFMLNKNIKKPDLLWFSFGLLISITLSLYLMYGVEIVNLWTNFKIPLLYGGDSLFSLISIARLKEGWIFDNIRQGWPFGSCMLDYPVPDIGSLLSLKFFAKIFNSSFIALNAFFFIGFTINYLATFVVARKLGLLPIYSFALAIVYNFIPCHFLRLGHLFYTWYFVSPLYFYLGYKLFVFVSIKPEFAFKLGYIGYILLLVFLSLFGVYYTFFGCIVLMAAAIAGSLRNNKSINMILGLLAIAILCLSLVLILTPNLIYKYREGPNVEATARNLSGSEIYGFKLTHLLFPQSAHRLFKLQHFMNVYNAQTPLNNENTMSTLGFIGSMGFLLTLCMLIMAVLGKSINIRFRFAALITMILFLWGTIGGFGSIFANLVSPMLRGWNRISIFIAFSTLFTLFLCVQQFFLSKKYSNFSSFIMVFGIIIFALYDQTSATNLRSLNRTQKEYEMDKVLLQNIEKSLPAGAAIYQLPYMPFPETPPLYNLPDYGLSTGFLHSQNLKWSYGGMKGRDGDLFYRALSKEPLSQQLKVIRRLGFAGIYIDKRGYEDDGVEIEKELSELLKEKPLFSREDGMRVFFALPNHTIPDLEGKSPYAIMQQAGFVADKYGKRTNCSLHEGFDFSSGEVPIEIKDFKGLSATEHWGRWSDANDYPKVVFMLHKTLPQHFRFNLKGTVFAGNIGKSLIVKFGNKEISYVLSSSTFDMSIDVRLEDKNVYTIEIIPPTPVSPKELGISEDTRKLGIGLIKMQIIPEAN